MFPTQLLALPALCDPPEVLKGMRGHHGGPHAGTRLLALVLVLLLAFPITYAVWQLATYVVHHLY